MTRPSSGHDATAFLPGASSLARKLSLFVPLSDADRRVLNALVVDEDPGDVCDPNLLLRRSMDHSIASVTPVRVAALSRDGLTKTFATRPRISGALWWSSMQEESVLRERVVSLGRRDARSRVAFLLCELHWRHALIGLAEEEGFQLSLTQAELGDTLGLTSVHVNRVLREFCDSGLITTEPRLLRMTDLAGLQYVAGFSTDYLHLDGPSLDVVRYFGRLEDRRVRDESCLAVG